jgi:hypothetical protein
MLEEINREQKLSKTLDDKNKRKVLLEQKVELNQSRKLDEYNKDKDYINHVNMQIELEKDKIKQIKQNEKLKLLKI